MDRLGGLVVIAPARRAGDPGSIPGPGEHFSLKLLIYVYIFIALWELKIQTLSDFINVQMFFIIPMHSSH